MKRLLFISVVFVALAILYFSTVQCPSKLAYPVAFLALMALIDYKHIGIWMVYGLVFSALGDWQGTQGNFFRQMALFGLAHIAYICYFASRLENKDNEKAGWATWLCVLIGVAAYIKVVPMVPSGTLRSGVIVYCLLILAMLKMALRQRDIWFALGAALFVISDFILAWNKFVSPIDHASWCIMVPYYGAQWLLFFRATSVASGACSCTSQGR
jgi:alkenylglycerophosphocholine/alkenylglycerophosphoethanolamine hydrolase